MKTLILTAPVAVRWWKPLALFALASAFVAVIAPMGSHWDEIFRPAALRLLTGGNPYEIGKFFNPFWSLIPMIPFALLPARLGHVLFAAASLCAFGYTAHRRGADIPCLVLFLSLPQVMIHAEQVNVDGIAILGIFMPPQIGLFFVMMKPQVGVFIAAYWLAEAFRVGGVRRVFATFAPVAAAFIISFAIFGNWTQKSDFLWFNGVHHYWPQSIPVGLALLYNAVGSVNIGMAIASAPFLAPYMQPGGWSLAALGVLPNRRSFVAVCVGMWIVWAFLRWPLHNYLFF
jgi:hypothetical protein